MYAQIITTLLFFSASWPDIKSEHALYISVIEITHNSQSQVAKLTIKVFTDDMQSALRNALKSEVIIHPQLLCTEHYDDVAQYFKAHMSLLINDSPVNLEMQTCEHVGDIYQIDFVLDCPSEWNELEISADFLMELFPTQTQMVHVTHDGYTETTRLTAKRKSRSITFSH